MNGGECIFSPKLSRELSLKFQGSCNLENVAVFAFHHPILLGRVNTRVLEKNIVIFEKRLE